MGHFTRYAAPTAGATTQAPGQRHICTDPPTQRTNRRRRTHGRTPTNGGLKAIFEGMKKRFFEGMKFYNNQSRVKLG